MHLGLAVKLLNPQLQVFVSGSDIDISLEFLVVNQNIKERQNGKMQQGSLALSLRLTY